MIFIDDYRKTTILKSKYPNATIYSVLYNGQSELRKLDPNYRWNNIPIPFTHNMVEKSIDLAVDSLKIMGSDISQYETSKGKIINFNGNFYKRGLNGNFAFDELEARKYIFIPLYRWMLENNAYNSINCLRKFSETRDIVLLDKSLNFDVNDISKPLSHAFLIKAYVEGKFPYEDVLTVIDHHSTLTDGKRYYVKVTKELKYKKIPCVEKNPQLQIEFDYEY